MSFDLILIIIFVSCFCFILFQATEFIKNYDFIKKFNKKYNKYEFVSSPSYDYVDKSFFDPNDLETNPDLKWRCVLDNNNWYALSKKGLVTENDNFANWTDKTNCINYIFQNTFLTYNNPCEPISQNQYCKVYSKYPFQNKTQNILKK